MKNKVNVLGVEYKIEVVDPSSMKEFENADGFANFYEKKIVLSNLSDWGEVPVGSSTYYKNQCLRHELIHAFMYESGLAYNTNNVERWAMNEEMVDWMAIQMPKIMETYEFIIDDSELPNRIEVKTANGDIFEIGGNQND